MEISNDILEKLKNRLHILDEESNENLIEMIVSSIVKLKNTCGEFDINSNEQARELVFERVRYLYNDVLEHFERNFAREITDLQMRLFFESSEENEETPTTAPVYDSRVFEVPSLDKLKTKLEYKSKDIYLSSALHSVLGKASKATITLDAGYLPDGFEEEVSGATKLADGVYGMGGKGTKKYFRFAFPMIDENGEKIIINFPKCQIQPTDLNVESQAEDKKEQMQQFDIIAMPLATGKEEESNIYYKADLRKNKTLDERKLLEKGFYNKAGLTELNKNTDTSSTTSASTTTSTNRVS
ncbi:hypothetical protein [Staphylococcus schweitzeri]|uniref:hypothetical protein n=1 Tax=Staphylococcus schweitzeri TaxID=1654388 RepID=UPI000506CB79|nr:Bacteriophage [Staphylococcus schweitzeri]